MKKDPFRPAGHVLHKGQDDPARMPLFKPKRHGRSRRAPLRAGEAALLQAGSFRTIAAVVLAAFCAAAPASAADWKATETVETYRISGHSGAELYASIGENGPRLGRGRVIAHTRFKLTWKRDYQRQGNNCVLTSARPTVTIITTLPKPASKLPPVVAARWETFIAGVRRHEAVHGGYVRDLVGEIEAATIGLTQKNDPGCNAIRAEMTRLLGDISDRRRARDRDFDAVELAVGGRVHQLILDLVNGP